jgi:hypothetical protein
MECGGMVSRHSALRELRPFLIQDVGLRGWQRHWLLIGHHSASKLVTEKPPGNYFDPGGVDFQGNGTISGVDHYHA